MAGKVRAEGARQFFSVSTRNRNFLQLVRLKSTARIQKLNTVWKGPRIKGGHVAWMAGQGPKWGPSKVLRAYRATSIPDLENEAQVSPIELVLDKTVLDSETRDHNSYRSPSTSAWGKKHSLELINNNYTSFSLNPIFPFSLLNVGSALTLTLSTNHP